MKQLPEFAGWVIGLIGAGLFIFALIIFPDPEDRELFRLENLLLVVSLVFLGLGYLIVSENHKPPMHL